MSSAKIVSWNVNGLRSVVGYSPWCHANKHQRLHSMLEFFDSDIICFQETKITRDQLSTNLSTVKGYITFYSFCNIKSGYCGVSTHIRESQTYLRPMKAQDGFTGLLKSNHTANKSHNSLSLITTTELLNKLKEQFSEQRLKQLDNEGRCLITEHNNFILFNIYFPNGRSEDRLIFKSDYHKCIQIAMQYFIQHKKQNVILLGDMNAKYQMIDSCDPGPPNEFCERNSTKWFRYLVSDINGLQMIDTFKYIHSDFSALASKPYTCWDTYTFARASNYGTRIDYILINNQMIDQNNKDKNKNSIKISDAKVMQSVKGSDHCPVYCEIIGLSNDCNGNNQIAIPKLASRFMPEFAGKQTNLMSFFSTKGSKPNQIKNTKSRKRKLDEISVNNSNSNTNAPKKQKLNKSEKNQSNLWSFIKKPNASNATNETKENTNTNNKNNNNITNKPKLCRQTSAEQWKLLFGKKKKNPLCHHGEQSILRTVIKNGFNRGKKFYVCKRGKGDTNDPNAQCSFFQWHDKPSKLKKPDSKKKPSSW